MKLADQYIPDQNRIESNALYKHYQVEIDKALGSPGDFNPAAVDVTRERYRYELSPWEKEFYEKLYVCFRPYPTGAGDDRLLALFGDALNEGLQVGEYEKDLIDFTRASNKLFYLVAPVGWGKTVLLKYVWFYLINKSDVLSSTTLPIYLSVDSNQIPFDSLRSARRVWEALWLNQMEDHVARIVAPHVDVNDDELWSYLIEKSGKFAKLKVYEEGLAAVHGRDSKTFKKSVAMNRLKYMVQDSFFLSTLKYLTQRKNVVVILDNVDPLDSRVHEALLKTAVSLTEEYNLRVVVSLRKKTFDDLAADPNGIVATYPRIVVKMMHKSFKAYITKRVELAKSEIDGTSFSYVDAMGKRLSPGDARAIMRNMLEFLLSRECEDVLDLISYHNLRKVAVLLRIYLSTGYIEDTELVWGVLERRALERSTAEGPLWVLLASILTANHRTHFSTQCPNPEVLNSIVNLYCNSGRKSASTTYANDHIIRFHVMNFFTRHNGTSTKLLDRSYRKLFKTPPQSLREDICHAVRRLVQCDLLASPDSYMTETSKDCYMLTRIEATDKGQYYRKRFASYFEYLAYMKDDINIGTLNDLFRDCVQVETLHGRYVEVYKFLSHVFEHEKVFLLGMKEAQRNRYADDFSDPETGPFVVARPVRAMVHFGERFENRDHQKKYAELLEDIAKEERRFLGGGSD